MQVVVVTVVGSRCCLLLLVATLLATDVLRLCVARSLAFSYGSNNTAHLSTLMLIAVAVLVFNLLCAGVHCRVALAVPSSTIVAVASPSAAAAAVADAVAALCGGGGCDSPLLSCASCATHGASMATLATRYDLTFGVDLLQFSDWFCCSLVAAADSCRRRCRNGWCSVVRCFKNMHAVSSHFSSALCVARSDTS